jgi:peptide/nickel transport system substrate-binding protein
MKPFVRPLLIIGSVVAASAVLAVSAEADSASTSASSASTALVVNLGLPPSTLDPSGTCSLTESGLAGSFYGRLTQYASMPGTGGFKQADQDTTHIKPWLATSWKVTNAGTTYTFKIRPGMKFPSGKPVDAAAFKYTLNRDITMGLCASSVVLETQYKPQLIKSMATPSPLTLVINLARSDPNFPQTMASPAAGVVDESVVSAHGGVQKAKPNQWMASHTAGYGPFVLKSYEPGRQLVMTANPGFFEQPASKEIDVNMITTDPTLLLQAKSGAADVTLYLSKQAVSSLKGQSCCRIAANDLTMSEYLNLPNNLPPFNNKLFREALTYAVPYQQILDKIAFGYGKLYYGEWMPNMPWFTPSLGAPRAYDLDKAKQLLKQSGVKLPVSFPIILPEGDFTSKQIATAVAGTWAQLGINVQVKQVSPSEHINVVYTTHSAPTMYYDGPIVVAPDYLWSYDGVCKNPYNDILVCLPGSDKLIAQLHSITDAAKRKSILDKVQTAWVADSPRIIFYQDRFTAVLGKNLKTYYFDKMIDMRTWAK